jgi:hypothetical protein
MLLLVGALCVALAFLVARFALHDEPAVVDSGSQVPVAPAKHHKPGADKTHRPPTGPAHTVRASGPHWSMRIPHSWRSVGRSHSTEDAAWRTPSNAGPRGAVFVIHKRYDSQSSLSTYTYAASAALTVGVGGGANKVLRTHVYAHHGEIEFLQRSENGERIHNLTYIVETSNGLASVTFTSPANAFKHEVKRVEPYLQTFRGR